MDAKFLALIATTLASHDRSLLAQATAVARLFVGGDFEYDDDEDSPTFDKFVPSYAVPALAEDSK